MATHVDVGHREGAGLGVMVRSCLVGLAAVIIAALIRAALIPVIGEFKMPLSLFAFAVAIAAWSGGLGAGLVATTAGAAVSFYFFFEPLFSFRLGSWGDAVMLTTFVGTGIIVSFIAEKVHRTNRELKIAKQRLELSYEASNEAAYDLDVEQGVAVWSPLYIRLFGAQETSGSSIEWWFSRVHPEDRERVMAGFQNARNGDARLWECQYRLGKADGTWADVYDRASFARREDGRAVRVVGAKLDVTELYASRQQLWMLSGLLPICSACRKIRDKDGGWQVLEQYILGHTAATFSHGMCPECMVSWYGDRQALSGHGAASD